MLVFGVFDAQAQSNTCNNGDALVVNTGGTKNNQCIPLNQQPAGTGTTMILANDTVTGTTVNRFAKLDGAPSKALITSTADTDGAIGIVTAGAGITGNATITILGQASCEFDGATTAGNYVVISAITAGMCHDGGSAFPTAQAAYGRVLSTNGGAGTYVIELMTPDIAFQNAGNGKSRPGGSNTQVQYNNSNQFGGITNATTDGTTLTVTSPKVVTGLLDTNGNPFIAISATASAVNGLTVTNSATGNTVDLATSGSDANINLTLTPKGTGQTLSAKAVAITSAGTPKTQLHNIGVTNASTSGIFWTNSSSSAGTVDLGLARNAAGILEVNSGSTPIFRDLKLRNLIGGGQGSHIQQSAANSDIAGTISISAATSASKTFTTAYTSAPICTITPKSDPTAAGVYWVTTSTSAVTANVSISATIDFAYICIGNPN